MTFVVGRTVAALQPPKALVYCSQLLYRYGFTYFSSPCAPWCLDLDPASLLPPDFGDSDFGDGVVKPRFIIYRNGDIEPLPNSAKLEF